MVRDLAGHLEAPDLLTPGFWLLAPSRNEQALVLKPLLPTALLVGLPSPRAPRGVDRPAIAQ